MGEGRTEQHLFDADVITTRSTQPSATTDQNLQRQWISLQVRSQTALGRSEMIHKES